MFLISLIVLRNGYLDKEITERNEKVIVKVIDCSEDGNRSYFLKFEFNNKVFVKRTEFKYCKEIEHTNKIELLSNKSYDRFIFPDEYKTNNNFLFGFLLSAIALIIIYKGNKDRLNL